MLHLISPSCRHGYARTAVLAVLAITALGTTAAAPAHARPICDGPCPPPPKLVTVYRNTNAYSTPFFNARYHWPLRATTYVALCEANSNSRGPYSNPWWTKLHSGRWVNNGYLKGPAKMGIAICAAPRNDGAPISYAKFNASLNYIGHEIQTNSRSGLVSRIRALNLASILSPGARLIAAALWAKQVRPGGPWDHKPRLRRMFHMVTPDDFLMDVPGTTKRVYYDIWSNIHYGYVGRVAGFTGTELVLGQKLPGTGRHSKADDLKVKIGIALYKRYPRLRDLTNSRIQQAIVANLPALQALDPASSVGPR